MKKEPSQPYNTINNSRKNILINNFLGGLAWSLGTTIGLTVVVALLGMLLKNIAVVPIVGQFVIQITDFVSQNSH